uniref:Zinc-binding protein A33-like n=1 Tax=Neogobius melanostomus TaxID=47308 RepID=A0A8C6SLS4_9GOBI
MAFRPEEDLTCLICQDIFKEPVVLSCSHSFCKDCLRSWWREKPTRECPVCMRRSSKSDPPRNLALRNLCEAYVQQREQKTPEEQVCRVHSERLKLFCLTDQQPLCVVCRDSAAHRNHSCKPIEEVTKDLREKLRKCLEPLTKNLQTAKEVQKEFDLSLAHVKNQFHQTERQIRDQFMKLHHFLIEEEGFWMKALREEEEQKTQRMKDKMAAVSREIEALSESIRATEEQLRAPDVSFLLKYKAAVERVQCCPLLEEEPQLGPEALIDQAKHLGNLTFNIWTNMKKLVQFTPIILDPNTAHPDLSLSDDLTSVRESEEERQLPKNPERIMHELLVVRGYEGYNSGSHIWEIDVKNSTSWSFGVGTESLFQIRDADHVDADVGWWIVVFENGQYEILNLRKKDIVVKAKSSPRRIKVHLECHKRKVTFYDSDTNTCIHSFSKLSQQKLFPILYSEGPMSVLPQKI